MFTLKGLITFLSISTYSIALIVRGTTISIQLKSRLSGAVSSTTEPTASSLRRRQHSMTTCGFAGGDASKPRTANSGFDCRIDTKKGLWGFCPTTVIAATDCGLAGNCVDSNSCTDGCGIVGTPGITTFTCINNDYCSTALLTFGVDQTYCYIACGATPATDHLLVSPTADPTTTTTTTTSPSPVSTSPEIASSSTSSSLQGNSSPSSISPSVSPSKAEQPSAQVTTEASSSAKSESSSNAAPTNNTGNIIGGVIGGLALVCICAVAIVYLRKRGARNPRKERWVSLRGNDSKNHQTAKAFSSKEVSRGGWGPIELHAYKSGREIPVELPADTIRFEAR